MGKRNARRQQEQYGQGYEEGQQTAAYAPPPAAAPEMSADVTTRLGELGKLHEQGVLTDEEFAQAKAKLLGV
jgi:hypothetical protein